MAFANSSISDIIATNIQSRSGELADNVTNNNALLRRLKERGNVKTFSGGNVILQEIMYNDTTTNNKELSDLARKLGVTTTDGKTYKLRAVQLVAEQRYQSASHVMTMFTGLLDKVDQMKQRIISKFAN